MLLDYMLLIKENSKNILLKESDLLYFFALESYHNNNTPIK